MAQSAPATAQTIEAYVGETMDAARMGPIHWQVLALVASGLFFDVLVVGDTKRCVALTNALFQRGIDVQPILYPAVRERAVRLRFFINRSHTEEQIRQAIG